MKLGTNRNNYILLLLVSLLVTVIYFSPFLVGAFRGYKPELRFRGDLQLAGYPAFIQTGKYFAEWTYYGIDFFTGNGASSIFMRPNFPTYYLPQFILQNIIHISGNAFAAKLFIVQMWLNGLLAMLFTTIWLNKLMKIDVYPSLLGGALFIGIVGQSYNQIAFFNVACCFPALMYCLCLSLTKRTDLYQKVLLSIPLVAILTAGYLPIAVMGVCIAFLGSLILTKYISTEAPRYKDLFTVLTIGGLVLSGYLIAIVNTFQIVPAVPKTPLSEAMFFADLALTVKGLLALFMASAPNDTGETAQFRLGIPILLLIYVSYSHLSTSANILKKNTFIICIILFLLSILLGMGRYSGFADAFFYCVPGLGGMHIYSRYMLISVFFLVFGVTLALSDMYVLDKVPSLRVPSVGIAIAFLLILLFPDFLGKNSISIPILSVELLISILIIFTLSLRGDVRYSLLLIPLLIFHQGSFLYLSENWATIENPGGTYIDIVNSESRTKGLTNYFYKNSNKSLVKYIDLTPEIEKAGGVPHNFPWFIQYEKNDSRRISSYMGYDQGLSHQLEYAQRFSYFGKYDKNYLIESGVDYVLYDKKTKVKESDWLNNVVDKGIPEHDVGNGFFAAKISQTNIGIKHSVFDNGIFKIYSEDLGFQVRAFRTNWSSKIELNSESTQSSILNFQLFPHKYWEYRLNGTVVDPVISPSGLASFVLPGGVNKFTIHYSNFPNVYFVYSYFIYIFLVILILTRYVFMYLRKQKFSH